MAIDGKTIGLALSGGGFRATLFGLGSLWRLNEVGLLGKLDRITSVSGGSILAGVLAHRWHRLSFDNGQASNFRTEIADVIQNFCSQTIDIKAGLFGVLMPFKTAGEFLADRYANDLFGDATMHEIPAAADGNPKFIFYATNLQTGRSFRFRQDRVADYLLGYSLSTVVRMADAVAASSAFPPVFSPIILRTDPQSWQEPHDPALPHLDELRSRIVLADGGVYDNMGMESLIDRVDISLISDAGAPFEIDVSPPEDNIFQLGRVRDILIDQTRALRKRWLIEEFSADPPRKKGGYWGIGTRIDDYDFGDALVRDNTLTASLENIPTRLKSMPADVQGHLINWGYALADAALRQRARLSSNVPPQWPYREFALH
jgi:NTE family protein